MFRYFLERGYSEFLALRNVPPRPPSQSRHWGLLDTFPGQLPSPLFRPSLQSTLSHHHHSLTTPWTVQQDNANLSTPLCSFRALPLRLHSPPWITLMFLSRTVQPVLQGPGYLSSPTPCFPQYNWLLSKCRNPLPTLFHFAASWRKTDPRLNLLIP